MNALTQWDELVLYAVVRAGEAGKDALAVLINDQADALGIAARCNPLGVRDALVALVARNLVAVRVARRRALYSPTPEGLAYVMSIEDAEAAS